MGAKEKQIGGGHYKSLPIQPSEYIVRNGIGWLEGNAIKYITRHKAKGGKQDLEKAIHYLELAIEEYTNGHTTTETTGDGSSGGHELHYKSRRSNANGKQSV